VCRLSRRYAVSIADLFGNSIAFILPAMTLGNIRVRPLSEPQERRLLDYLDQKYREIHQEYSKRSEYTRQRLYYPR
jgi:hypothetical protein